MIFLLKGLDIGHVYIRVKAGTVIRRECANVSSKPGRAFFHKQAGYMYAPTYHLTGDTLATEGGTIYGL